MRILMLRTTKGLIHPVNIDGTLESMQHIVGGYIENAPMPQLNEKGIALIVNEEGLLCDFPINENLTPFFFVGRAFMVGVKDDEFVSLTGEQLLFIREWLQGLEELK